MLRLLACLALIALPAVAQAAEVLRFKEENIRAKVQKPEVAYIYSRPDLTPRYDLELRESFLPRIEQSVQGKPF